MANGRWTWLSLLKIADGQWLTAGTKLFANLMKIDLHFKLFQMKFTKYERESLTIVPQIPLALGEFTIALQVPGTQATVF